MVTGYLNPCGDFFRTAPTGANPCFEKNAELAGHRIPDRLFR